MKQALKTFLYTFLSLVGIVAVSGFILAYLPSTTKSVHPGITPEEAAQLRQNYKDAHQQFKTTDSVTLFLRRWDPDSLEPAKQDIAVLIFHGITAHSGAYNMAGVPFSAGGYTVFGLDYRGHGLSDGNRGDSPGKDRWTSDLAESIRYIKSLGFKRIIVMGHSLGVAAAICAANAVPDQISGLVLLSGAYESKKGSGSTMSLVQKGRILAATAIRPSYPVVEYYREGMAGAHDPLFNFRYTLRFMTMYNVKELKLPETMDVPVLVGVGDKDELFAVDKVKEFYDLIPGDNKEFLVMKNATHAVIPVECWEGIVGWMDRIYNLPSYPFRNTSAISSLYNGDFNSALPSPVRFMVTAMRVPVTGFSQYPV